MEQPFRQTKQYLAMMGITEDLMAQSYPVNWKLFVSYLVFIVDLIITLLGAIYEANSILESVQSIYCFAASIMVIIDLTIIVFRANIIFTFIASSQKVINTTLTFYPELKEVIDNSQRRAEKFNEIMSFVLMKIVIPAALLPWISRVYFNYFTTDLGNAAFELPIASWFPFDYKNPYGYLLAGATEYLMGIYMMIISTSLLSVIFVFYFLLMATTEVIKRNLNSINANSNTKRNRKQIMGQLKQLIEYQTISKQWVNDYSDYVQAFGTVLLFWSLITICGALLLLQMLNDDTDSVLLIIVLLEVFFAFGLMLTVCELCQRETDAFEECSETFCQLDWYTFPNGIQRMLPIFINFGQQPVEIKCYGSTPFNRELFKLVVNKAYSFFTLLRRFYD